MDWRFAMKEERAALKRMVALLFALADLAESAGRRSALVRRFVIWVLRRAETLAWDFVIGAEALSDLLPVVPAVDGPAEAMRLAQSFRHLACELDLQAKFALAVQDDSGQAEPREPGARQKLVTDDLLNTLHRFAFRVFALPSARATGPPDMS